MAIVNLTRIEQGQLADYPAKLRQLAIELGASGPMDLNQWQAANFVGRLNEIARNLEALAATFALREQASR